MKGQLAYKDQHGKVYFIIPAGLQWYAYHEDEFVHSEPKIADLLEFLDTPAEMTIETPAESIQQESADKAAHPDLRTE